MQCLVVLVGMWSKVVGEVEEVVVEEEAQVHAYSALRRLVTTNQWSKHEVARVVRDSSNSTSSSRVGGEWVEGQSGGRGLSLLLHAGGLCALL